MAESGAWENLQSSLGVSSLAVLRGCPSQLGSDRVRFEELRSVSSWEIDGSSRLHETMGMTYELGESGRTAPRHTSRWRP
jgi:hypothetical protein